MSEPHVLADSGRIDIEPAVETATRRLAFECSHGATSAKLFPGAKAVTELLVLDILLARHHGTHGCNCIPAPRWAPAHPALA